ncbi:MAG: hypothetical protein WEC37_02205 [Anaerolineales bacterium]
MLTLDMLYAVLQGVPAKFFDHLDRPWSAFCENIAKALADGSPPADALRFAIQQSEGWQMDSIRSLLVATSQAMHVRGLSYRQRELLLALRTAKVTTLTHLSHITAQDTSNTHKRLAILVARGHALKFYRPGGPHYFALTVPLSREFRKEIHAVLLPLLEDPNNLPPHKPDSIPGISSEFAAQLIAEAKASAAHIVARFAKADRIAARPTQPNAAAAPQSSPEEAA